MHGTGLTIYRLPLVFWFVSLTTFLLLPSLSMPIDATTMFMPLFCQDMVLLAVLSQLSSKTCLRLFRHGFIFLFTIGGPIGIAFANFRIDIGLDDTYYVLAYFYHASFMGAVFTLFVGFHYRIENLTFSLTNFLVLLGMTYFILDYLDAYIGWNALISFFFYVLVSGIPPFFPW
ncbi:hypothetical protein KP509_13G041500 [Ceratopteris richardii]|uniref:Cytochrome oxidase subunit I profile domain-containing protein n=1 Tax=Ceratopteris richardii TaxID=49495 RepID=A0A8T2TIF0_CERRI|nr:hypothetical protein KP509_13G041500 [Ceratopteris richardii]